jgi:hypothetical protein
MKAPLTEIYSWSRNTKDSPDCMAAPLMVYNV